MQSDLGLQSPGQTDGSVISDWLLQQGLQSVSQHELLEGYCQKLIECGIPLMRLHVAERAFHPLYGGVGFDWSRESGVSQELYEHTTSPQDRWTRSPLLLPINPPAPVINTLFIILLMNLLFKNYFS